MVIDREKVVAVLLKRFPCAPPAEVAAAANAIVGLAPEYQELPAAELQRFECYAGPRQFTTRHVASGEVRIYCRGRGA